MEGRPIALKDYVAKTGGDYTFEGVVVCVFPKLSGAVRVVVENAAGLLHIFSATQLRHSSPPEAGVGECRKCAAGRADESDDIRSARLGGRALRACIRERVETFGQLAALSADDLRRHKGPGQVGPTTLREIREALYKRGLALAGESTEPNLNDNVTDVVGFPHGTASWITWRASRNLKLRKLLRFSEEEIRAIDEFRPVYLEDIRSFLSRHGLKLAGDA